MRRATLLEPIRDLGPDEEHGVPRASGGLTQEVARIRLTRKKGRVIRKNKASWQGVYPAVTTQFFDDQSMDFSGDGQARRSPAVGRRSWPDHARLGRRKRSLERQEKLDVLRATVEHVAGPRAGAWRESPSARTALACRFAADAQKAGVGRADGAAGDGLQVRPARDGDPFPRRRAGDRTCRFSSTTTRSPTASISRRRCSRSWPTSRSLSPSRNRRRTFAGSPI